MLRACRGVARGVQGEKKGIDRGIGERVEWGCQWRETSLVS